MDGPGCPDRLNEVWKSNLSVNARLSSPYLPCPLTSSFPTTCPPPLPAHCLTMSFARTAVVRAVAPSSSRLVAAQTLAKTSAVSASRGFATSLPRSQAVPQEKPVLNKEFKIYRWVRPPPLTTTTTLLLMSNHRTRMNRQRSQRCSLTLLTWINVVLWYAIPP